MKTWLPAPLLSIVVLLVWLLLMGSVELVQWLFGALLGVLLPLSTRGLRTPDPVRRPLLALRLALVVLLDIVTSNVQVAIQILGPSSRLRSGFIWVPLDLTSRHGITTLAGIITMTPGTLSTQLSADSRHLLVHCLNLTDEAAQIAQIKQRYEAPLKEIFP